MTNSKEPISQEKFWEELIHLAYINFGNVNDGGRGEPEKVDIAEKILDNIVGYVYYKAENGKDPDWIKVRDNIGF